MLSRNIEVEIPNTFSAMKHNQTQTAYRDIEPDYQEYRPPSKESIFQSYYQRVKSQIEQREDVTPLMIINSSDLIMTPPVEVSGKRSQLTQKLKKKTRRREKPSRVLKTSRVIKIEEICPPEVAQQPVKESIHVLRDKSLPAKKWKQVEQMGNAAHLKVQMKPTPLKQLVEDQK